MLTANLLSDGAPGAIRHFIYNDGHAPPDLPIAILVEFCNYCGPPFLDSLPKCVPVIPITFEWDS